MTNKLRNELKKRLEITQKWCDYFLEREKNRKISIQANKALNKDKPFLGLIFILLYLPTKILGKFLSICRWNAYNKACKEMEIIIKELKDGEDYNKMTKKELKRALEERGIHVGESLISIEGDKNDQ